MALMTSECMYIQALFVQCVVQLFVVDAIGLLFNASVFTYSLATFLYIGRWSTQHVCTLDGLLVFFFWCLHMKGETHSALI